jgi:hypothetical protein
VKHIRIGFTIGFLVFALICLIDRCNAEEYRVNDFIGGINVATDSTDLLPNQALNLTNLTFDMPNVLTSREGYSYWNDSLISDNEIQAIFIYEPYADTLRLTFACNGFIYINDDLSDPGTVDWDTLRLSFTDDSLNATASSATITVVAFKNPWWYLKTGGDNSTGDHIIVDEDNSETEYAITKVSWTDDDEMTITPVYAGTTGVEMNYTVYRKILGDPYFAQFRDELYVCDSDGFPIIYDDTSYSFVALLDSGIISSVVDLNDTVTVYSDGLVKVKYQDNKVYGNSDVIWQPSWADSTWDFESHVTYYNRQGGSQVVNWSSTILDVDSANRVLTLEDVYPYSSIYRADFNPYEIKTVYYLCVLDSGVAITDTNKNWMDIDFLDGNLLTGLRSVFGSHGVFYNRMIGCNSDIAYKVPKTTLIAAGKSYYIFAGGIPYYFTSYVTDDTRLEYPRYKQIAFYKNQMFGLGHRKLVGNYSSRVNDDYDVIWYSYPSIPRYSPALDYNFSVDKNENNNVFFHLRDRLFIGTENSIWSYSGIINESFLHKTVANNGIPDIDNFVKSTEEYGYFTNRTGVYRFNGVRPEKISWLVDPIIEQNYNSRIVMVYQNQLLYVSFTDSNFTQVFDERYPISIGNGKVALPSYRLDFGMTCAYAPPDTDIIYFGLKGQNGRIYYYPNGEYWDRNSPTDSSAIKIEYKSGWQTYAGYWLNKAINEAYFPMLSPDTATISIYSDFSGTADDVVYADSASRFVYRKNPDNDATGEYFQVAIRDTVYEQIIIGGYKIEWETADQWKK